MCRATNRHFTRAHAKKALKLTRMFGKGRSPDDRRELIEATRARDARTPQLLKTDFEPVYTAPRVPAPVAEVAPKKGRSRRRKGLDALSLLVHKGISVKLAQPVVPRTCSYGDYANA